MGELFVNGEQRRRCGFCNGPLGQPAYWLQPGGVIRLCPICVLIWQAIGTSDRITVGTIEDRL